MLGEVCREYKGRPDDSEDLPVVGLEHLSQSDIDLLGCSHEETTFTKGFRKGHVLFGRRRAYLKKASLAPFDGVCSGDIIVIEAIADRLCPGLLPFVIQNDYLFDFAVENSAGSLSPRVKWKDLSRFEFDLPCMAKQEELARLLWSAQEVKRVYSRLVSACGEIVKSRFIEMFAEYKNEIELTPLEEIVEKDRPITYGIVKPGQNVDGGVPVIKVKDFPSGEILMDDLLYASPEIESKYERSRLLPGDLLFSIRGSVGRMAFVPEELEGANLTQDTARLTIRPEYNSVYIRGTLSLPQVDEWVAKHIRGVAMQGVNLADLRKLMVPILSYAHQCELSSFAQQVDKSEFALKQAIEGVNATMAAILNKELGMSDVQ